MSQNISIFGLSVAIRASTTFPSGFVVTEFSDDQDPLDSPELAIADKAMGINGDLVMWQKPAVIEVTMSVIPNSPADRNLSILAEANRTSKTKGRVPMDEVTMTAIYQDGRTVTLSRGVILSGMFVYSGSSAGRMKTRVYKFAFEDRVEVQNN